MSFAPKILLLIGSAQWLVAADPAYQALWMYQGHWKGTRTVPGSAPTPVDILNRCGRIGTVFGCQQIVDGKAGAVVMYTPADTPGHFYTQAILPDGRAAGGGGGELIIAGNLWTFQPRASNEKPTTYYKTTNLFNGKNRIHFEQLESTDGEHWEMKASGDEVRVSGNSH